MDNTTQTEMLTNYAIFCLERQRDVLKAYRRLRREYWELAIAILLTIVAVACALASIACATMRIFDGWAAAMVFILDGISAAMFVIYAKVSLDNIHDAKAFIVEANNVYTTLEDIIYIVDRMNNEEDNND